LPVQPLRKRSRVLPLPNTGAAGVGDGPASAGLAVEELPTADDGCTVAEEVLAMVAAPPVATLDAAVAAPPHAESNAAPALPRARAAVVRKRHRRVHIWYLT